MNSHDDIMFSVIMPVFNKGEHVRLAIDSILNQKNDNYEIILIDDCSKDGSAEIIDSYKDKKVRVLKRHEPGPGGYAARNLGAFKARYPWLAFLDADDFWYDHHLQQAARLIKEYPHIESFNFSREKIEKGKKQIFIHESEGEVTSKEAISKYSRKDIFHTNSIIISKRLFNMAGGFPAGKCKRGGDSDLWLRMLLHCDSIVISKEITSCYIIDNSGVIYGGNNSKVDKVHPVYNTVSSYLKENPSSDMAADLRHLANRKNISLALARKRSCLFSLTQLNVIFISCLETADWLRIIQLISPLSIVRLISSVRKRAL
ncbi:glycosyltransferase family 2 protein [Litchfieldella anticariensis]|uniref:glycosyltransferase family 2 protein n=1 Tax=Litchfieldella anticariensis TaxID=258591 RepID=UPI0009DC0701|nr:glycosyltransferase family A protein [Halomonas anticariensis]